MKIFFGKSKDIMFISDNDIETFKYSEISLNFFKFKDYARKQYMNLILQYNCLNYNFIL